METITIPYSGEQLVSHLAAYGLAFALDAADIDAYVRHDPDSLSFDPIVEFAAGLPEAVEAIRHSALEAELAVEADVEAGTTGNDRRAVIWARASFAKNPARAGAILARRQTIVASAEASGERVLAGLLAGLGAPAAWGSETLKPSGGATALDGVLGNKTSDLVRGVLRPARVAAAEADEQQLREEWRAGASTRQLDKTGWAPPGAAVDLVHQWLAALGLALLPVAHQSLQPSVTPACWTVGRPRRLGITLPLLSSPTTVDRLRGLLAVDALATLADHEAMSPEGMGRAARLRSFGLVEAVAFERLAKRGSGTSVAFSFRRGRRVALGSDG